MYELRFRNFVRTKKHFIIESYFPNALGKIFSKNILKEIYSANCMRWSWEKQSTIEHVIADIMIWLNQRFTFMWMD